MAPDTGSGSMESGQHLLPLRMPPISGPRKLHRRRSAGGGPAGRIRMVEPPENTEDHFRSDARGTIEEKPADPPPARDPALCLGRPGLHPPPHRPEEPGP